MYRQIIKLEGTINNVNLPDLDVTQAEIDAAQISGLTVWPAMYSWGASPDNAGLLDRLTDAIRMANGSTAVSTRFAAGGTPSLEGYAPNAVNQAIVSALDTSESFTVGLVVRTGCAFGSYSSAANAWWIINDNISNSATLGKLRLSIGGISSTFAEYAGPVLTATDWHRLVLIVDRAAGTIKVRHNGVDALLKAGLSTSAVIPGELAVGVFNTGAQSIRAAQYRSPIAFNRALSGDDLAIVEALLLEKTLVA